jgi:hypothetical protein
MNDRTGRIEPGVFPWGGFYLPLKEQWRTEAIDVRENPHVQRAYQASVRLASLFLFAVSRGVAIGRSAHEAKH